MDAMMTKVMKESQELIPCEHCTVVIIDQENTEVHSIGANREIERMHYAYRRLFSHKPLKWKDSVMK